mgnify:CR=1 FL=1
MKRVVEQAKEQGYVETLFGRRRYLPELKSGNFNMRAFGERVARNMPIQGARRTFIKIAMIRVSDRLAREGLQGRLILQVHDELIVECPQRSGSRWSASSKRRWRGGEPLRAHGGGGGLWPHLVRGQGVSPWMRCVLLPLCGGPLARQEHRAVCPQGHSFDVARQGYVHLLPVNKMHAKLPGDSREMVESRRRFLEAGYYELPAGFVPPGRGVRFPAGEPGRGGAVPL